MSVSVERQKCNVLRLQKSSGSCYNMIHMVLTRTYVTFTLSSRSYCPFDAVLENLAYRRRRLKGKPPSVQYPQHHLCH